MKREEAEAAIAKKEVTRNEDFACKRGQQMEHGNKKNV